MAVDKIDQLEIDSTKYDIDLPPDAEVSIKSVNASDSIKVNDTEVLKTTDISDWAKASTKPTYTANEVGALPSTTKYAASSSVGGPATSAAKLTNTAKIGDINKPVYFTANGVPEAISYTIATSVPSGAVFTDTQSDWSVTDSTSKAFIKNKPTIPTVNNGTLTIQKNGANVQTFTANQSTNVTANITVPTTYSDVGAAAAHHLYHTWDNNTNYYDNYEGGNMFRIVTENMYADCFRFQASTVSNLEYYNGSSWVSWDFDLSNLFDGNARTGVSIPYANRKFRFQLTANGGWPTTALFMLQGTWFSDGGWPSGQKSSIIIETRANTSADWSQKASFDLSGVQGMAGHTLSSLHTGQTLYRITIEIAPWTNTSNACPLRRLCLFSNYNGGALEKITHDGNGNVTIPTLKSTTIYENGTSLASKYQKILPTTTTAGKVLKSTTTAGTVEWADDTNTTYTIASGDSNGQIKVTPSSGTAYNVDVKGLGAAAYKAVDTSVTSGNSNLVTSGAVYTAINNLPEPMVFKGTLGTNGTITSLPTASSSEGFTYKVITAGTYASQAAKVGDVFVSNGSSWVLIPSGDDVEDTWRNIKVNNTELLGTGISTGAVNFKNGGNITVTGSGNNITLGVASGYSIPSTTNQTAWSAKYDKPSGGIPDSHLASTFVKKVNNSAPDSNGNVSVTSIVAACAVGSDSASTAGWYKIASSTLSGYGNQNILYFVKGGFTNGYSGILNLEMRSENTSVHCWKCCWVARHPNLTEGSVIIVINGMTWTMYAYNASSQNGRLYFTEISNRSIDGGSPTWSITYFNSNTPEATKPTAKATSSDGFIVARAKEASDAYKIVESLRKGSEADSAVGYYKIATINHVTWNFCDFCMLVKNSYSDPIYSTIFNCSCSDSNTKLQNFNLEIISGTDISNKLAYLYTYDSSNNLIKVEVFIHATRFEHPMCYILNARLGQQLVIPTQDEFNKATPDKPDDTTMTGKATYNLALKSEVPHRVTGSWPVSTTNPGPMVDIILNHPDIKIYYKTYTSSTRRTDIASVLFNASYSDRQGIYSLSLKYLNASGNLTTIGAGTIYYEYFD